QLLQAPPGGEMSSLEATGLPALGPVGVEEDVVYQRDPLAPVVEGSELADHRHHRIRETEVVGRRRREPLDLAYDVVAEIPDETSVQGWQLLEGGRPEGAEQRLDATKHALIARHRARE